MVYRDTSYDHLFKRGVSEHFPVLFDDFGPLAWLIIKGQCWQGSSSNPKAVSSAGAIGLMQIMPKTAQDLGMTDPIDPEQSINGGVDQAFAAGEQYGR